MKADIKAQVEQLKKDFAEKSAEIKSRLDEGLIKAALLVEGAAKRSIVGRPEGSEGHPSPFPYVDTGRLRASITHRLVGDGNRRWAEVGTNVEYAPELEFGTSKRKAYPFLQPALDSNRDQIAKILKDSL